MTAVPPILVTGAHRSGTTWTANMLALAEGAALIGREPFNAGPGQWALNGVATCDYAYVPGLDEDAARRAFRRVLRGGVLRLLGRQGRRQLHWLLPGLDPRVIVKDPLAAMSSEWIAREFDVRVLVVVRHPAAFALSLLRVGWDFDWATFTGQQDLLKGPLEPVRADIADPPEDPLTAAGLLWRCVYTVLSTYLDRNPSWEVRTHEKLSMRPTQAFRDLYGRLGLEWDGRVRRHLEKHTSGESADAPDGRIHDLRRDSAALAWRWREILDGDEQARIRRGAGRDLVHRFYGDTW